MLHPFIALVCRSRRILFETKLEDIRVVAMEKMAEMESGREKKRELEEMKRKSQEDMKCVGRLG